jgi:chromosome segregation ATPase
MTELAEFNTRLDNLEDEVAKVRCLAMKADRDASDGKAVLNGHTGVLNAIREDQVEQGKLLATHDKRLGRLEHRVDDGFAEMREGFHQANENFATIEAKFQVVKAGMDHITNLLTPGQPQER